MEKEKEIDSGSNQYLKWTETLYEDDDLITYEECGYGEVLKSMPGIDDDIKNKIKIKKSDLGNLTFEKLFFVLKNLQTNQKLNRFRSFLDSKGIKYDFQIWQLA